MCALNPFLFRPFSNQIGAREKPVWAVQKTKMAGKKNHRMLFKEWLDQNPNLQRNFSWFDVPVAGGWQCTLKDNRKYPQLVYQETSGNTRDAKELVCQRFLETNKLINSNKPTDPVSVPQQQTISALQQLVVDSVSNTQYNAETTHDDSKQVTASELRLFLDQNGLAQPHFERVSSVEYHVRHAAFVAPLDRTGIRVPLSTLSLSESHAQSYVSIKVFLNRWQLFDPRYLASPFGERKKFWAWFQKLDEKCITVTDQVKEVDAWLEQNQEHIQRYGLGVDCEANQGQFVCTIQLAIVPSFSNDGQKLDKLTYEADGKIETSQSPRVLVFQMYQKGMYARSDRLMIVLKNREIVKYMVCAGNDQNWLDRIGMKPAGIIDWAEVATVYGMSRTAGLKRLVNRFVQHWDASDIPSDVYHKQPWNMYPFSKEQSLYAASGAFLAAALALAPELALFCDDQKWCRYNGDSHLFVLSLGF